MNQPVLIMLSDGYLYRVHYSGGFIYLTLSTVFCSVVNIVFYFNGSHSNIKIKGCMSFLCHMFRSGSYFSNTQPVQEILYVLKLEMGPLLCRTELCWDIQYMVI